MKTCPEVDAYIATFPAPTQAKLQELRSLIRTEAPEAEEGFAYKMPSYKLCGGPLVYFAGYAKHIGLYALPQAGVEFQAELAGYKTSKGTIQFPLDQDLPQDLIRRIVRFRIQENQEKASLKSASKKKA